MILKKQQQQKNLPLDKLQGCGCLRWVFYVEHIVGPKEDSQGQCKVRCLTECEDDSTLNGQHPSLRSQNGLSCGTVDAIKVQFKNISLIILCNPVSSHMLRASHVNSGFRQILINDSRQDHAGSLVYVGRPVESFTSREHNYNMQSH